MLKIRKLAVLAALVALVAVPAGAKAFFIGPVANAPGPFSVTIPCFEGGFPIISLGVKTFNLTDVTIANSDQSLHTVAIVNSSYSGVSFAVGGSSTFMQKFETPIRFIGAINGPYLFCDANTSSVQVSLQGTIQ